MAAPSVSIVVPTYRRPRQLAECLASLAALDYPRDRLEVLVVDDADDDPSSLEAVVGAAREELDVVLVRTGERGAAGRGPAQARNLGAERARGDLLAFTDDDCRPERNWLSALQAGLHGDPERAVGGRIVHPASAGRYARANQVITDCVFAYYNADASHARFFPSNNLAVPREPFLQMGGFDRAFRISEDRDFCDRWISRGYGMTYAADAVVYHVRAVGLGEFAAQHFGYGRGAWRFHRARARRGSGSMLRELGFYRTFARTVRTPLREAGAAQRPALIALLGLWQAANAAGFAWEGLSGPRRPAAGEREP